MRLLARWWRPTTLLVLALLVLGGAGWGLPRLAGAGELASRVLALEGWTGEHPALSLLLLGVALFLCAAAAMPIGGMITAVAGALLGTVGAGTTGVLVAPLGALVLFHVVRRSFGDRLRARLEARWGSFVRGFQSDAASYLVCLRLTPTPFWLVNISAAVLGVRPWTFWWTTMIGIMPMTFAHAAAGAAIGDALRAHHRVAQACAGGDAAACATQPTLMDLITPSTVLAFAALGVLALTPVLVRRLRARPPGTAGISPASGGAE